MELAFIFFIGKARALHLTSFLLSLADDSYEPISAREFFTWKKINRFAFSRLSFETIFVGPIVVDSVEDFIEGKGNENTRKTQQNVALLQESLAWKEKVSSKQKHSTH